MGTLHYSDDLDILRRTGIERPANVAALDEAFKKAPRAKGQGQEQTGLGI